jgi:2-oxoisovalerate dehydrogenase E2 component (dihydrolipoyl transacylase)
VREDTVLAAVMTDKATVETPPVDGEVLWLGAEVGDTVAIGSPIVRLKVAGEGNVKEGDAPSETAQASAKDTPTPNPSPQGEGNNQTRRQSQHSQQVLRQQAPKSSESPPHGGRGKG